jgi:hypothetical protein
VTTLDGAIHDLHYVQVTRDSLFGHVCRSQQLRLARSEVRIFEVRRLHPVRTAAATVLGTAAVWAALVVYTLDSAGT